MSRTAIIFPGQGSQMVGMGRDVYASSPAARSVFVRANQVLGFDLAALCFEGPAERLERTDIQQPAILVVGVALWEAMREAGATRHSLSFAGGLSLGEYTALQVAGSLDFEDAVRLVALRGRLMQEAAVASPSGMVSLMGADEVSANALCAAVRNDEVLVPANFNCPGQIVISGHHGACQRAVEHAEEMGLRAVALPVAGAFHSPLMQSAADALGAALEKVAFHPGKIPVIANVDADYHQDAAAIRDSLRRQVTHPVLWQKSMERLITDGAERFVEVGPGRVLTGLMRKINRRAEMINVNTVESIAAAGKELQITNCELRKTARNFEA